jgi:hypothetical protein
MSTMRQAAEDYLALRRAMGFKLEKPGRLVLQFADHLDRLGTRQLTIEAALAWVLQPAHADPTWWAYRLSAVRGFAAYLHPRLPGTKFRRQICFRCAPSGQRRICIPPRTSWR